MGGWVGGWLEKTEVIPNSTQLKLKLKLLELSLATTVISPRRQIKSEKENVSISCCWCLNTVYIFWDNKAKVS